MARLVSKVRSTKLSVKIESIISSRGDATADEEPLGDIVAGEVPSEDILIGDAERRGDTPFDEAEEFAVISLADNFGDILSDVELVEEEEEDDEESPASSSTSRSSAVSSSSEGQASGHDSQSKPMAAARRCSLRAASSAGRKPASMQKASALRQITKVSSLYPALQKETQPTAHSFDQSENGSFGLL